MKLEDIEKVASDIQNFRDCYEGIELWAGRDGSITANQLINFMIDNPHMQEIANQISVLKQQSV